MRYEKKLRLLSAVIMMAALTGCGITDSVEVRDRTFIRSASLSSSNDSVKLSLYPFGEDGDAAEGSGKTPAKAVENASAAAGKDIFMGHLELMCYDSTDFTGQLHRLLYDYRISPSCRILYLKDVSIDQNNTADSLPDSINMMCRMGMMPQTDLFSILSETMEDDGGALVPVLSEKGLSMCIIKEGEKPFYLSARAAEGLVWLRGDNYPDTISINGENGTEDYRINSAHTELSAEIRGNIPYVEVNIQINGSGNADAAESVIKALCKAAADETIKKAKSDVIGFGRCLKHDCPEYYREQDIETAMWAAVFEYDIQAD